MKIVKFKDGTYAVRKGWCCFTYLYVNRDNLFTDPLIKSGQHCKVNSLDAAQELLALYKSTVEPHYDRYRPDYGTIVYVSRGGRRG